MSGIRSGYDRWAAVYDHDANPLLALEEPVVHAALGDVRGAMALDLGCGTGRHAPWLAAQGATVTVTLCTSFGSTAGGTEVKDDDRPWKLKNATADGCPST